MSAPTLQLRDYQTEAIEAYDRAMGIELRNPLIVLPTGAGKTVLFLGIGDRHLQANPEGRVLVIAHRKELVTQPEDRFRTFYGDKYSTGVISATAKRYEYSAQVIFAGKDTIISDRHMTRLLAYGPITLLITDEAHHAQAVTYRRVVDKVKAVNPRLIHLGVTATPTRADGQGLGRVFDAAPWSKNGAIYSKSLIDLIPRYLVPPRWLVIKTGVSLDGVKSRGGDYIESQLKQRYETPQTLAYVVKAHKEHAMGKRSIAFTISVQGAKDLAALFNHQGIPADHIDGTMAPEDRAEVLRKFQAGEIEVLANCAILTEGFDDPAIEVIHMVRPTKSDGLYLQCIGRGLRPRNGHMPEIGESCLILEYAPEAVRSLEHVGFLMGVPPAEQSKLKLAQDQLDRINTEIKEGEIQAGFAFDGRIELAGVGIDGLAIIAMEMNYLESTRWHWHQDDSGWLSLSLGESAVDHMDRILILSPRAEGQHTLYGMIRRAVPYDPNRRGPPPEPGPWKIYQIGRGDFQTMTDRADQTSRTHANKTLASKDQSWHAQPMSEAQEATIKKLSRKRTIEPLTKGQASQRISHLKALAALRAAGYYDQHQQAALASKESVNAHL